MKTKNVLLAVTMLLSIGFTSCKKGDTGEPGKDGVDGNANVTYTKLTATSAAWAWSASDYWRYATWTGVSALTADAVDKGAVMLYQKVGTSYLAIPLTMNISTGKVEHDFFMHDVGTVMVFIENSDFSDPISQIPNPIEYKLVCIPQKALEAHPEVDLMNFNSVRSTFKLKE